MCSERGKGGYPLVPCLVQAVSTREPYKGYGCRSPQGARKAGCPLSDRLIDLGEESGGGQTACAVKELVVASGGLADAGPACWAGTWPPASGHAVRL